MASKKVVIAGESLLLTQTLTNVLRKEGLEVLVTKTGPQTLKIVELENPDLLILDIVLPPLNGLEVMTQLRKAGHNNPVILMSDYLETELKKIGIESGANSFMKKPVDTDHLVKRVKELLKI